MQTFNQSLADDGNPYWYWGSLVFSCFYFLPLVFNWSHFDAVGIALNLVIYGAFLGLYSWGVYCRGVQASLPVIGILTVSIVGAMVTPGTQSFFGFAAYFCGFNFSKRQAWQGLVGVVLSIFAAAQLFIINDTPFLVSSLIVSIGLFFFGMTERQSRIHKLKEAQSESQIEQLAAIAERERIARDLHDLLGHSLSSIALKAELAGKFCQASKLDLAQAEIDAVAELSREVLSEVRQAVSGLKLKGINEELHKLSRQLQSKGFAVEMSLKGTLNDAKLESSLILILREAVTNILRHSNGNAVSIDVETAQDEVRVSIIDNGVVEGVIQGNGLKGITERCQQFLGHIEIDTVNGMALMITLNQGACSD